MATPVKTSSITRMLGAPQNWNEEREGRCLGLPITEAHGYLYSYWQLTLKERCLALLGRPVRLCVASSAHPPVQIEITKQ